MYPKNSRSKSIRYAALAAVALLPPLLPGAVYATQQPEDELVPFAQPMPFMPFEHGDPDDNDALFAYGGYNSFGGSTTIESLEEEAKRLDERIKGTKEGMDAARKSDDKTRLRSAELRLESLEQSRVALRKTIDRAKHLAPLQKKVDVKFDNATVAQAAEALSRASGVRIKVDDTIPDTTRLTVEARKVRLATVLESVARQAGLTIDPINLEKGDIGVELIAPPLLRVNNTTQKFAAPTSPWSDKWGTPPTSRYIYTTGVPRVWNYANGEGRTITRAYTDGISAEVLGSMKSLESLKSLEKLAPLAGIQGSVGGSRRIFLTDDKATTIEFTKPGTITVTEAAKNDKNEDGHWRTIYQLKNGELIQQSRTWEKSNAKKPAQSGWLFETSYAAKCRV